jgi:carbamoyl-phosphate synthase large subunit
VIYRAEEREEFRETMAKIGLELPRSKTVTNLDEAREWCRRDRPALRHPPGFTLGGTGGGIAYNRARVRGDRKRGLDQSP